MTCRACKVLPPAVLLSCRHITPKHQARLISNSAGGPPNADILREGGGACSKWHHCGHHPNPHSSRKRHGTRTSRDGAAVAALLVLGWPPSPWYLDTSRVSCLAVLCAGFLVPYNACVIARPPVHRPRPLWGPKACCANRLLSVHAAVRV